MLWHRRHVKTDNSGDNVDDDDIWAQTSQFDLTRLKKDTTNPETYVLFATYYRLSFARLKKKKGHWRFKNRGKSRSSRKPYTCWLPNDSSIFTDELGAILFCLSDMLTNIILRKNRLWYCHNTNFTSFTLWFLFIYIYEQKLVNIHNIFYSPIHSMLSYAYSYICHCFLPLSLSFYIYIPNNYVLQLISFLNCSVLSLNW